MINNHVSGQVEETHSEAPQHRGVRERRKENMKNKLGQNMFAQYGRCLKSKLALISDTQ